MIMGYGRISETYIFRRNDLLELVERELSLTLAHIVPEDRLKPLNVLPGKSSVLSKIRKLESTEGSHSLTSCW